MNKSLITIVVLVSFSTIFTGCTRHGMVESNFSLSTESRLPKWFNFKQGALATDYSVNLTYYTSRKVKVVVLDKNSQHENKVLFEVMGDSRWHPISDKIFKEQGNYSYFPKCDVVTINGKEEVLLQLE